jgi:DNA-binding NarL/FixJ family response regulator
VTSCDTWTDAGARGAAGGDDISVVIADSDAASRARVRTTLEADGFVVLGEPGDAVTAVPETIAAQPDIVLIDIEMPGGGLDAVAAIAKGSPRTTIIILTVSSEPGDLLASLERGASGYLLKSADADDITSALRGTRRGQSALSPAMAPALMNHVRGSMKRQISMPTGPVRLTAREWDVAELLRDGFNTVEISQRLGISQVTVRRHIASVLKKLGTANRTAAVRALKLFAR